MKPHARLLLMGTQPRLRGLVCLECHTLLQEKDSRRVNFSHPRHRGPGLHCPACHPNLGHRGHITPNMEECTRAGCHDGQRVPNRCPLCHLRLAEVRPAWHSPNFLRQHASFRQPEPACDACHERDFCDRCHQTLSPHPAGWGRTHRPRAAQERATCRQCHPPNYCRDCHGLPLPHPPNWRTRQHQSAAQQQPDRCEKCHGTSFCQACHARTPPASHDAQWRKTHGQGSAETFLSCAPCHEANYCRDCHGLPLPHPPEWVTEGHRTVASFAPDASCFRCHQRDFCAICHFD